MDKLLIAEANGEDRFGRKMRYQWFLDWKFCLKAKGFFSIGHGTILQVTNKLLFVFCNVAERKWFSTGTGSGCHISHLSISTVHNGESRQNWEGLSFARVTDFTNSMSI